MYKSGWNSLCSDWSVQIVVWEKPRDLRTLAKTKFSLPWLVPFKLRFIQYALRLDKSKYSLPVLFFSSFWLALIICILWLVYLNYSPRWLVRLNCCSFGMLCNWFYLGLCQCALWFFCIFSSFQNTLSLDLLIFNVLSDWLVVCWCLPFWLEHGMYSPIVHLEGRTTGNPD